MTESLKQKTVSGLKWTGIEKLFLYIFVFFAGIFLNRKLFDEDYGLVAVLSIFTYLANALQDSGFPQALIRKKDVTEADYNTVFYFSICTGIFLYTVLFFCAPIIADSYNEPKLVNLSRFIFLSFVFNAFSSVQSTQITKSINYKLNTKISIASTILSYSLAICLAFLSFGPWALASQMVALQGFRMIFLWIGNRWRPQLMFSMGSFKSLFGFGSNLLLKSILDTISTRITPNIIGRYLGLAQTGIYDNGNRWYGTCFDFVSGTILNVTYPILSKVEEDRELARIYRKIVRTTSFIVFPMFLGLFLIARPFMLITIGEKWAGSIGVLQILAIGGIFIALNALSMHIIKIKGKSSYILYTELIYTALVFAILFVGVYFKWNLYQIVAGIVASNVVAYIINSWLCNWLIGYKLKEYLRDILPYLAIAVISIAVGFFAGLYIQNLWLLLITQIVVVGVLYVGITYMLGSKVVREVKTVFNPRKD